MHAKLRKLEKMNLCYKTRITDTMIFLMACLSVGCNWLHNEVPQQDRTCCITEVRQAHACLKKISGGNSDRKYSSEQHDPDSCNAEISHIFSHKFI